MPFEVKPVPETYIDASKATDGECLVIEFENGQRIVFRIHSVPSPRHFRCDLARTSPELIEQLCYQLQNKWARTRPREKAPFIFNLVKGLSVVLLDSLTGCPRITVGQNLNVSARYGDLTDYGWVAGNSLITSISSHMLADVPIIG